MIKLDNLITWKFYTFLVLSTLLLFATFFSPAFPCWPRRGSSNATEFGAILLEHLLLVSDQNFDVLKRSRQA
jgi:hypothetical protein